MVEDKSKDLHFSVKEAKAEIEQLKADAKKPRAKNVKGDLLANSLDTYASQKGVAWRPDRKEVYTAVAFVVHQHILTHGEHLIMRTDPPVAATLSKAPTQAASPVAPASSPLSDAPSHPRASSSSPDDMGSPDLPASVRRSFVRAADAMHGLRYSLDLSPVVEQKRPSGAMRPPTQIGRAHV